MSKPKLEKSLKKQTEREKEGLQDGILGPRKRRRIHMKLMMIFLLMEMKICRFHYYIYE
ncbi:hypothetical protein HanIR_Chr09g0438541 [Helianthus annuus]|nr:hypothetical protein HanIR_Chr09g0438541 [Helianthus annuus]